MKFSQRIGLAATDVPIQAESMNDDLKNSLWNAISDTYLQEINEYRGWKESEIYYIAKLGHANFFKLPIDDLSSTQNRYVDWLRKWFFSQDWFRVYDYIEWLASYGNSSGNWKLGNRQFDKALHFRKICNIYLERENSAYRFVEAQLVPVSNKHEISEIELGLSHAGYVSAVANHIAAAVKLMGSRTNPDFRNSIKESISAVEAAANVITGDSKATLGQALKVFKQDGNLHPALQEAFSKLYGWSSDAEGIRHAMMEKSKLDLADARFMLVACSAFANYLIDRSKAS